MTSKKALILGVSGFVGGALAKELIDDGWDVYGAARFSSTERLEYITTLGVKTTRFDVTTDDPSILPDIDVLFLEIWDPANPEFIWPINYYGVGKVVQRYSGIADIVNGCTINVYGNSETAPDENTLLRPSSEYGQSRAAQERLIDYFTWKGGKMAIHVRYAHANAPGRGVVWRMANSIIAGQSLGADPDAFIQVIALEDFVRVTKEAFKFADNPSACVNCCHPKVWSRRELANQIQMKLGKGKVVFDRETGGIENSACADVSRMIEWFGEPKIGIDELLNNVLADLI